MSFKTLLSYNIKLIYSTFHHSSLSSNSELSGKNNWKIMYLTVKDRVNTVLIPLNSISFQTTLKHTGLLKLTRLQESWYAYSYRF